MENRISINIFYCVNDYMALSMSFLVVILIKEIAYDFAISNNINIKFQIVKKPSYMVLSSI